MTGPDVATLRRLVRDVPDFPEPGVLFRDITPLLGDAGSLRSAIDWFAATIAATGAQAVVGIESRGFVLGAPAADRLGLPFVPVRKPGKLPAARMSVEYTLEYGSNQLDIHADAFAPGTRVAIVDDLLATGGTGAAAAKLVELVRGEVAVIAFLIELTALGGRERLAGYELASLIDY